METISSPPYTLKPVVSVSRTTNRVSLTGRQVRAFGFRARTRVCTAWQRGSASSGSLRSPGMQARSLSMSIITGSLARMRFLFNRGFLRLLIRLLFRL